MLTKVPGKKYLYIVIFEIRSKTVHSAMVSNKSHFRPQIDTGSSSDGLLMSNKGSTKF